MDLKLQTTITTSRSLHALQTISSFFLITRVVQFRNGLQRVLRTEADDYRIYKEEWFRHLFAITTHNSKLTAQSKLELQSSSAVLIMTQYWLVTGGNRGIGLALVQQL